MHMTTKSGREICLLGPDAQATLAHLPLHLLLTCCTGELYLCILSMALRPLPTRSYSRYWSEVYAFESSKAIAKTGRTAVVRDKTFDFSVAPGRAFCRVMAYTYGVTGIDRAR